MASKKYAYYIKGNKIGLVQVDDSSASLTTSEYGMFKSPINGVTDGLEVQYTYAPTYNLSPTGQEGTGTGGFTQFLGYGSNGTNLTLFTYDADAHNDISGYLAADSWIYIDRGRWQGLHQIQSIGTATGILVLKTRYHERSSTLAVTGAYASSSNSFTTATDAAKMDVQLFKNNLPTAAAHYFYVPDAEDATNNGFFEVEYSSTTGQINFINKITIAADTGAYTTTAASIAIEASDGIAAYNAYYEPMRVYEDIDVMQDESFELDLPRNLSNAVVYYLKAKMMEDMGDFDKKEYFMREYKKLVEKHNSAKSRNIFIVQGNREITR